MKVLIFASVPPPVHGQSQMVRALLDGLSADPQWQVHHVNATLGASVEDLGRFRLAKAFRLLRQCAALFWLRCRFGEMPFYYVPAPAACAPLLRDWVVLTTARICFPRLILHWHALGLSEWLEVPNRKWAGAITRALLGAAQLSLVVAKASAADATQLAGRQVRVLSNGIADPFPDYDEALAPRRTEQLVRRQELIGRTDLAVGEDRLPSIRLLYLSVCSEQKGLFSVLDLLAATNAFLEAGKRPFRLELDVAGEFVLPEERLRFDHLMLKGGLNQAVRYHGWVSGEGKLQLLAEADCFCFLPDPSRTESFGLVLLEAMAAGLPIVAHRVHAIPEILGEDYPGLKEPGQLTGPWLLQWLAGHCDGAQSRSRFLTEFSIEKHLTEFKRLLCERFAAERSS